MARIVIQGPVATIHIHPAIEAREACCLFKIVDHYFVLRRHSVHMKAGRVSGVAINGRVSQAA